MNSTINIRHRLNVLSCDFLSLFFRHYDGEFIECLVIVQGVYTDTLSFVLNEHDDQLFVKLGLSQSPSLGLSLQPFQINHSYSVFLWLQYKAFMFLLRLSMRSLMTGFLLGSNTALHAPNSPIISPIVQSVSFIVFRKVLQKHLIPKGEKKNPNHKYPSYLKAAHMFTLRFGW